MQALSLHSGVAAHSHQDTKIFTSSVSDGESPKDQPDTDKSIIPTALFKETNYSGEDGDYNRESYRYYRDNSGKNNSHEDELDVDEPDDNDENNTNKEDNNPANGKQNPTKDNNNQARNADP